MLKTFAEKEKSVERPAFFSKKTEFKLYFVPKDCAEIRLSLTLFQNFSI